MLISILALLGGLVLLTAGAYGLVRGAAALALRFGLPSLVVGLTVVAFGTRAPELVVSVDAALRGAGGIAVGNVVGSNIANVGLILALAALLRPITVDRSLIRWDGPIMLIASGAVAVALLDGRLGLVGGSLFVGALVTYLAWTVRSALHNRPDGMQGKDAGVPEPGPHVLLDLLWTVGGLGLLVGGADLLVTHAVIVAEILGVSNAVIGLTVVALGTSLPELATSLVAALRGEGDLAAGNVIGSNTFNVLGILGTSAIVRPLHAPGLSELDLGIMLLISVLGFVFLATGGRLSRPEGLSLLAVYGGYMTYLAVMHQ